jgi:DNA invertase Pin-like site-specific DNA recombinase
VHPKLVGEFTEAESGKCRDRPKLERPIAACKKHRAKLIAKLDRLSRSVEFIATMLERSRVDFICVDNPHANKTIARGLDRLVGFELVVTMDELERAPARGRRRRR